MKHFFALLFFLSMSASAPAQEINLISMLEQVQKALARSDTEIAAKDLPSLDHVNLKLNVSTKISTGGKVSFWVVKAGAETTSEIASTVEMRLEPPDEKIEAIADNDTIAEALIAAILAGAETKRTAENGEPPLRATSYSIKLAFTVSSDGSGGLAIAFPPFKIEAEGGISSAQIQEISVVFKDD